jgi:2-polyprenyl-3-methyl-5-hydroxy-6-metoxy-1,4-benzoquinol methylase
MPDSPSDDRAPDAAPTALSCLHCGAPMRALPGGYAFECTRCGLQASNLQPAIDDAGRATTQLDEAFRHDALEPLRRANFERVLDVLDHLRKPQQRRLLDVGCAHGWFVEAAERRGYAVTGLEPDARIAAVARTRAQRIIAGFFPGDLPAAERYDVITFHDVFEHLPDPRGALAACHERLDDDGLLVLNLPSSEGVLFRTARALARIGIAGPLDRLWQRGFPSPHLTYFTPEVLASMLRAEGFEEVHRSSLPSFTREGLWQRLRYDRATSIVRAAMLWPPLWALSLVIRWLPGDISLQVFRRA